MVKLLYLLAFTATSFLVVQADEDSRLIGGIDAKKGQFPHHVQLRNIAHTHGRPFCGGSIIGHRFVLSSNECVQRHSNEVGNLRVIVGEFDRRDKGVEHLVDKLIPNPQATFGSVDVGVVRVTHPFTESAYVKAIELPTADIDIENEKDSHRVAIVVGWGQFKKGDQNDNNNYPQIMQWRPTTTLGRKECLLYMGDHVGKYFFTPTTICSSGAAGENACIGDHGGGLIGDYPKSILIGVLAWAATPCHTNQPNVHARVFPHLAFIRSAMQEE